jgi:hypothetical protein
VSGEPKQEAATGEANKTAPAAPDTQDGADEPSHQEQARQAKRQQRLDRFEQVRPRHAKGQSIPPDRQRDGPVAQRGQALPARGTLSRLEAGQARRTRLDGLGEWIDEQIQAGRENGAELHRDLMTKGYQGSADSGRRFVTRRLSALGKKRQRANAAKPQGSPQRL